MAGVAQRDVDTISNQSGDTFLLSDVDTDFPSVEQPAVLPSSLPVSTVSENSNGAVSNVSYAAITAASTPAAAPRVLCPLCRVCLAETHSTTRCPFISTWSFENRVA